MGSGWEFGERGVGEGDLDAVSLMSWRGGEGGGEVMVVVEVEVVGRGVEVEEEEEMDVSVRVGRGERGVGMEVGGVADMVEVVEG